MLTVDGATKYWEEVKGDFGPSGCNNIYTDVSVVGGPVGDDYVALEGGRVAGRLTGDYVLQPGDQIIVYELDGNVGGTSEPFAIYMSASVDCMETFGSLTSCATLLTDSAVGTTSIIVDF